MHTCMFGKLLLMSLCMIAELTNTCDAISSVSLVTGAGEATRGVGTGSIGITVINTSRTLISI